LLTARRDEFEFELVAPAAVVSLFETIATHGGRVAEATIADGEFRFVVELPRGQGHPPDDRTHQDPARRRHLSRTADHRTQRARSDSGSSSVLEDELTEKQRAALETAYFAGYFDWPRGSTGEEIAERPRYRARHLQPAPSNGGTEVLQLDVRRIGRLRAEPVSSRSTPSTRCSREYSTSS